MRAGVLSVLLVPLLVATLIAACSEAQPTCFSGEFAGCSCAVGVTGYQTCLSSQEGYGTCVCDGKTPGVDADLSDASNPNPDAGAGTHKDGGAEADADVETGP